MYSIFTQILFTYIYHKHQPKNVGNIFTYIYHKHQPKNVGNIFTYIYHKHQPKNVGKYTMDPMVPMGNKFNLSGLGS